MGRRGNRIPVGPKRRGGPDHSEFGGGAGLTHGREPRTASERLRALYRTGDPDGNADKPDDGTAFYGSKRREQ